MNSDQINNYIKEIHERNIEAGWWSYLKTGESILKTRNRPEIMLLIVSELSEASEGHAENLNDDKLPQRKMAEVELADAAIRLFDLFGAEEFYIGVEIQSLPLSNVNNLSFDESLMVVVNSISFALEGYRKTNIENYRLGLIAALNAIISIAKINNFDLVGAINEKLEYNKNRADHKVENRLKDGGKKI